MGSTRRPLAERSESRSSRFDRWARTYERDPVSRFIAGPQNEALRSLELDSADRFCDVGCGTGAAVRNAAMVASRAVGVDASVEMVGRAEQLAGDSRNATFVAGDATRLPFADGAFTAVLCTTSFHHYADPRAAAREIGRVTAAAGRLALGDGVSDRLIVRVLDLVAGILERSHVAFQRSPGLVQLFEAAGFTDIRVRTQWFGGYALLTGRKA